MASANDQEHHSTSLFRTYIRIKSVQPNPDYESCMEFLKEQAAVLGLPYKIMSCVEGKPFFIMTWQGTNPSLPAVLLNSHTDVVPVFPEHWTHEPFAAVKDEKGDIYGRGTQDMKSVGIQHIEAVKRLKGKKVLKLKIEKVERRCLNSSTTPMAINDKYRTIIQH